uniref:Uncharacterized protein n=1 Tax=Panagrellus redivivus TaxID=6233 RepID=A0A7E4ZXG0_PANRE
MSAYGISRVTSAFLSLFLVLLALFTIVTAQNFGSDPFAFRNTAPYNGYNPYGNLGTRSTWEDSIVLHLFGGR